MRTPIAFIIFNRPDLTARVFAEIARARPEKLLVIADGPRPDHEGEDAKCAATRAIIERVDWPCEILKNYSDVNLGCGHRPATGLRWVFEQVDEAIILEDDCVPHPTFFRFCEELLDHYRDDERVMHISGDNFTLFREKKRLSIIRFLITPSLGAGPFSGKCRSGEEEAELHPGREGGSSERRLTCFQLATRAIWKHTTGASSIAYSPASPVNSFHRVKGKMCGSRCQCETVADGRQPDRGDSYRVRVEQRSGWIAASTSSQCLTTPRCPAPVHRVTRARGNRRIQSSAREGGNTVSSSARNRLVSTAMSSTRKPHGRKRATRSSTTPSPPCR